MSTNWSALGWGPGWPEGSDRIIPLIVGEVSWPGGVDERLHDLTAMLIVETERRGYSFHPGWCWGYGNRAIKPAGGGPAPTTSPPGVPSAHSFGVCGDHNAPTNPYTRSGLTTDMPPWMPDLWTEYGFHWGGFGWGGSARDPMHYEFVRDVEAARDLTARAMRDLGGDMEELRYAKFYAGAKKYLQRTRKLRSDAGAPPASMEDKDALFGWQLARSGYRNGSVDVLSSEMAKPDPERPAEHADDER